MPRPLLFDDGPPTLLRAFSKQTYAHAFLEHGKLRMRNVLDFREVDGARQDASEGTGALMIAGDVPVVAVDVHTEEIRDLGTQAAHYHYTQSFLNPTYLFCSSTPAVNPELLKSKFGQHLVVIYNPLVLFSAIRDQLGELGYGGRSLAYVECFPVRYDKGAVGDHPDSDWRVRLSYGQKPETYRDEHEYRCAVVLEGGREGAPTHLDLVLANPTQFCRSYSADTASQGQ